MSSAHWLRKLTDLNPDKGNAPHKPLLLLIFLELVEKGEFVQGNLPLTPELAYRFDTFFEVVRYRRSARPDIRLPFHHLSTQNFWSPKMANGEPSKHRSTTAFVVPDPDFVEACRDPEFRERARQILIAGNFEPAERCTLYSLVGMPVPTEDELARTACYVQAHDAEEAGRSARFRLDVVSAYKYTCALTGYRVTTIAAGSIVDAAHIHRFADSRNNDPTNGLALCKNAHWLFDAGLWSIDDDYRVVVAAEAFSEESPNQQPLKDMVGKSLLLPHDPSAWPSQVHIAWHRQHKFVGTQ